MEESQDTGVIYCIENIITHKKYIGQAKSYILKKGKIVKHGLSGRFETHLKDALSGKNSCPKLYNSLVKYGKDNFSISLIEICKLEDLNEKETYNIKKFNTVEEGYNILYSNSPIHKNFDTRKNVIEKISNTMKDKWSNDEEYIKKTTENNLKAVIERTKRGTRITNKELPNNIYKTENGFDIRIMRNGVFKITSVESKILSYDELILKAIEKRDQIFEQIKNNDVINFQKKYDHNGNDLPIGIHLKKARNQDAYGVKIIVNGKVYEKCVSDKKLSMDEKLTKAKILLNKLKILHEMENPQVQV
jgi:group I intron endonuclease